MGSSASEVIFLSVNHNITLMGKVWLVVMVFLRVLILLLAGYPLYQDEQERFVCNTIQPGCANVCYDLFSPISLFRFWLVQLITVSMPYIIFIVYVVHKASHGLSADLNFLDQSKDFSSFKIHRDMLTKTSVNKVSLVADKGWTRCFTGAYVLHLLLRTLLEAGFGAAHYYLFGFYIPRRFLCQAPPCTTQVDCYISRPTEKTVMLNFMLGAAALCLFLDVLDFIWAVKRSVRKKSKRKMMVEKIYEEERCFLSGSGEADPSSAAQQDAEAEVGHTASFRKRQGSKGSCAGGVLASGQGPPCPERSSLLRYPGPPGCNTNGNNGCSVSQEEAPERNGSEVALCPPEPIGTPRSIRVSKRSRLKPPPPPRRELGSSLGDVPTAAAVCTRRVGQYTLVELSSGVELQNSEDGQEKRSEWV